MRMKPNLVLPAGMLAVVFLVLILLIVTTVHLFSPNQVIYNQKHFIEGEYSVDGGEWKPIDPEQPIDDLFHTIVLRGTLVKQVFHYEELCISTENVWYILHDKDDKAGMAYLQRSEEDWQEMEDLFPDTSKHYPFAMQFQDTPGYCVNSVSPAEFQKAGADETTVFTLEITNPYDQFVRFSDCFSFTLSHGNGILLNYFQKRFPFAVIYLMICFLGLFLFPLAGFFRGKVNFHYLMFGAACLMWGISSFVTSSVGILNFFITDQVMCMILDILLNDMFILAMFCYLHTLLKGRNHRNIASFLIISDFLYVVSAVVLQFAAKKDLFFTSFRHSYYEVAIVVAFLLLLFRDTYKDKRRFYWQTLSSIPLAVAAVSDIIAYYIIRYHNKYLMLTGFMVTMLFQIVHIVHDLRRQFLDKINYQRIQKELYEAKVGVMVSQIQPHFMYNALSSIAILCKLDPDTAYQATITFSDYLRENMDSLKQTAPVPFQKELEHLKKYLYIEKMRFSDMLNIEYDIQATDFEVPLLSVQPLVENAVKHGVGMKEDGGTVKIATLETENAYEIHVSDNGVGFDTSAPKPEDGRSHVGMENTKKRLHDMCGASITVESVPGKGTTARIIIPKQPKEEDA